MRRALIYLFGAGFAAAICAGLVLATAIYWMSRDLPDHRSLREYEPPVLSRVHAGDGAMLATFARERRIFTPIEEIPDLIKYAFVSAEDKNYYKHTGVDPEGIVKAAFRNVWNVLTGRRLQGASTITQQVAKNMLLTREVTAARKIREAILAVRLARTLSKDRILELYLNENHLGARSFGVTAAALAYFGKSLDELELHEAAYLAALPKGPNNYHPVRHPEKARARRAYVLSQMVENGYVRAEAADEAARLPLGTILERPAKQNSPLIGRYFVEEVRRTLLKELGEDTVYEGGLSIRTTISRQMQVRAEKALRNALESFDQARGYSGPVGRLEDIDSMSEPEWRRRLAKIDAVRDIPGWRLGVVLEVEPESVRIGIEGVAFAQDHRILFTDAEWARSRLGIEERVVSDSRQPVREIVELGPDPESAADIWSVGDVVYVAPTGDSAPKGVRHWSLRQIPEVQGAFLAMDPRNGRILAMQGGFSFESSSFNRATQAKRQPGSSIKPIVYAAALDNGYTPATLVLDAPLTLEQGEGLDKWRPRNSNTLEFSGPTPLRRGIEESRNLMTVRIARDISMASVADYAERLGVYDQMPRLPAYALGAGETTLLRMVRAYAAFANGGNRVEPSLIDRIQDRRGKTIDRWDDRPCVGCQAEEWIGQEEPYVPEDGDRVLDPVTAYQVTSLLEGVVQRGTGRLAAVENLAMAGKTGTTNAQRDAWFVGYTPEIVAGCYIGYDTPLTLGRLGFGGRLCGPVVGEFLAVFPGSARNASFPQPAGIVFAQVERQTGRRVADSVIGSDIIREAFRSGAVPAVAEEPVRPILEKVGIGVSGVQSGTGGLY